MSAVKVKKLIRITWILIILNMILIPPFVPLVELLSPDNDRHFVLMAVFIYGNFFLAIATIILLLIIRGRLTQNQRKPLVFIMVISGVLTILSTLLQWDDMDDKLLFLTIGISAIIIFVLSIIYVFTCYLHLFDKIFLGLFTGIVGGLVLKRFGVEVGGFIFGFCFFLSFYGFLFLAITHSKKSKESIHFRRLISTFSYLISFIFLLLFIKFSHRHPANARPFDAVGAIIFLLSAIALFISLPFSNFVEWFKSQRQIFYRVILLPFFFFLILFSLTFLLPDSAYRRLFFVEFSLQEKVHFRMEDYTSEID